MTSLDSSRSLLVEKALPYYFNLVDKSNPSMFLANLRLNPTISSNDWWLSFYIFIIIAALRFFLTGVNSLSRYTKFSSHAPFLVLSDVLKIPSKVNRFKFSENLWYSIWHLTSFIWSLLILNLELGEKNNPGWFRMHLQYLKSGYFYWLATEKEYSQYGSVGWPLLYPPNYVKFYYLTQLAFWVSCFFYYFLEKQRKDSAVMLAHHILTILLVYYSFVWSYWRLGLAILCIHDSADIFLYTTKVLYYTSCERKVVDLFFVLFGASYLVSRLIIYPVFCVAPVIHFENIVFLSDRKFSSLSDVPGGKIMLTFLLFLLFLHIYWFSLIVRLAIKNISKRNFSDSGDIRSSEDENSLSDQDYDDAAASDNSAKLKKLM